ncbi:MAG: AMP-binding protein [Kofleriaceae bacterium]
MSEAEIVYEVLHELLAELGGRPTVIAKTADLERDLGLGSLERLELLLRLERKLSIKLPEQTFARGQTPAELIEALAACEHGGTRAAERSEPARPPAPRAPEGDRCHVPDSLRTLVDLARFRAEHDGDRAHLVLLDEDGGDRELTFGELWRRGLTAASSLAARGVSPGDRVAIILPTGVEFFTTFLGILCAGCVPVPLYPPARLQDLPAYVKREMGILASAGARVLVTDRQMLQLGKLLRDRFPAMIVMSSEDLEVGDPSLGLARVAPDDLALIQYSSGSTGDPKGVALPHRSLLANARAIGEGLAFRPSDVPVSWLPLYHDMGLIGTWLSPYLHGMKVVMMSPLQFLARPERWLWAFHRHGGSISPAPNFGYDLCCRKIRDEDIKGLDLTSWRSAMNGSEPVRADTVERFCARFGPYGFRREAMMPVYGLAETSVALAFSPVGRGPLFDRIDAERFARDGHAVPTDGAAAELVFASCGVPLAGHEVKLVDASGDTQAEVGERTQGRILFRGPSSMTGYFGRPDATAAVRDGEWIDSGDLGYLADGELFVTGRMKDLIIKGGRKFHPQDIERAIQALDGVRKGCIAAFDVPSGASGEAIVVLVETSLAAERHEDLTKAILAAVQDQLGTPADHVRLLPPGSLPKTSSGKLRRRQSRSMYLEGAFDRPPTRLGRAAAIAELAVSSAAGRGATWARGLTGQLARAASTTVAAATVVPGLAMISMVFRGQRTTWTSGRWVLKVGTSAAGLPVTRSGPALPERGAILVSNHASYLDWLVLTLALEQPFLFTAKSSVFSMPILGRLMQRLGHIRVERGQLAGRHESFRVAREAAERGELVHFFPEATFTSASGLRPFRLGAFQLAAELGLPIIPIAIKGTRRALRDGDKLLEPTRLEVKALPAIPAPPLALREISACRDLVREQLAREVDEPLLDIVSAALPNEVTA